MKIDISDRVDAAIKTTNEWAAVVGFRPPEEAPKGPLSKKARDVVRILGASEFGCQFRQVKALVEVLLDEKLPEIRREDGEFHYENPHIGFIQGIVLVPIGHGAPWTSDHTESGRPGMMMRVAKSGNVGLRYSNGELGSCYFRMTAVRPANEQEIRDYFAEFYGAQFSKFDTIEEPEEAEAIPF